MTVFYLKITIFLMGQELVWRYMSYMGDAESVLEARDCILANIYNLLIPVCNQTEGWEPEKSTAQVRVLEGRDQVALYRVIVEPKATQEATCDYTTIVDGIPLPEVACIVRS